MSFCRNTILLQATKTLGGIPNVLLKTPKSDRYFSPSQTRSLFKTISKSFTNFVCKKTIFPLIKPGPDYPLPRRSPQTPQNGASPIRLLPKRFSQENCSGEKRFAQKKLEEIFRLKIFQPKIFHISNFNSHS